MRNQAGGAIARPFPKRDLSLLLPCPGDKQAPVKITTWITAMAKQSAGIVLYRFHKGGLQVLLGHIGEPRHAHEQNGSWSIPKGELNKGEAARTAAFL